MFAFQWREIRNDKEQSLVCTAVGYGSAITRSQIQQNEYWFLAIGFLITDWSSHIYWNTGQQELAPNANSLEIRRFPMLENPLFLIEAIKGITQDSSK